MMEIGYVSENICIPGGRISIYSKLSWMTVGALSSNSIVLEDVQQYTTPIL